jgi:hypothetical protein
MKYSKFQSHKRDVTCWFCKTKFTTSVCNAFLCEDCWEKRVVTSEYYIKASVLRANWRTHQWALCLPGEAIHRFQCLCCGEHFRVGPYHADDYACHYCYKRKVKPVMKKYNCTHEQIKLNWNQLYEQYMIEDKQLKMAEKLAIAALQNSKKTV